jgi:hypothetical protein
MSETEMVTCTKCGAEWPLGTGRCEECNSFLKGGKTIQAKGGKSTANNRDSAKRLLKDSDLDWDDCGEALRVMALRAVNGSSADMNAYLRHVEELKPNPKQQRDEEGQLLPELVITGETTEAIDRAMARLRKVAKDVEEGKVLLARRD